MFAALSVPEWNCSSAAVLIPFSDDEDTVDAGARDVMRRAVEGANARDEEARAIKNSVAVRVGRTSMKGRRGRRFTLTHNEKGARVQARAKIRERRETGKPKPLSFSYLSESMHRQVLQSVII